MEKRSHNAVILITVFLANAVITGHCYSGEISITPTPQNMENKNMAVDIGNNWNIVSDIPDPSDNDFLTSYLNGEFLSKTSISFGIWKTRNLPPNNYILLALTGSSWLKQALKNQNSYATDKIGEEGYILDVFNDRIIIIANNRKGVFYGIQTLLQLAKSSERGADIDAVKIIDYPRIKNRGVHFSGPNPKKLKGCIDKIASLKLNTAIIETQDYYDMVNKGAIYEEIFEYARERNIEPVPELASFGTGAAILKKDPLAAEGIFVRDAKFKTEKGEIRPEDPVNHPLLNVIKGGNCDIQVKSAGSGEIYREGTDYDIIRGGLEYPYSSDTLPTKILQKKNGKIKDGDEVLVSYNYVENKNASWAPWSMPYCPSYEGTYEIMSQAITETINMLHPRYLSIGHDEIRGMNRDSRCIARNLTNAQLLAYDINRLYSIVKECDDGVTLFMWADMLNPFHNGGDDNCQTSFGGPKGKTAPAIDLISRDIVMLLWNESETNLKNAPPYFYSKGFNIWGAGIKWLMDADPQTPCSGIIATTWDGWDKNLPDVAKVAEAGWH